MKIIFQIPYETRFQMDDQIYLAVVQGCGKAVGIYTDDQEFLFEVPRNKRKLFIHPYDLEVAEIAITAINRMKQKQQPEPSLIFAAA